MSEAPPVSGSLLSLDVDMSTPPFAAVFAPWVQAAIERVVQSLGQDAILSESLVRQSARSLAQRLGELAAPALVAAVHADASPPAAARLYDTPPAWVPRECYADLVARLHAAGTHAMLDAWPVLATRLPGVCDDWVRNTVAFGRHLQADRRVFSRLVPRWQDAVPAIASVVFGLSDPHRGGRTVACVTFADGVRLAYKPRSLAPEAAFTALLHHLATTDAPSQYAPPVLDRGDHGWMAWVEAAPMRHADDARDFMQRCGGLLALIDVLRGGDLHPDNVIAMGAYPVLVDLECLFQPSLADLGRPDFLDDPLLFTNGLLPTYTSFDGGATYAAVAGCGAGAVPLRPQTVLRHDGTDWVDHAWKDVASFDGPGPVLDGCPLDLRDYRDEVTAGFRTTWQALVARRPMLLGPDGILSRFHEAPVRLLCAPTNLYALWLDAALAATNVGDEARCRVVMQRARRRPPLMAEPDAWAVILAAEQAALTRLDVPLFIFQPKTRGVQLTDDTRCEDVFTTPMSEQVADSLRGIDEAAIQARTALVDAVLTRAAPLTLPASADLRACLRAVADRVAALAVPVAQGGVAWVRVWEMMPAPVTPAGPGFCYGATGMAVFLAEAAHVLEDDALRRLAGQALAPLRHAIEADEAARLARGFGPGYGRGIGGMIAGLTWCGDLLEAPALWQSALQLARESAVALSAHDGIPDLMDGASGLALGLGVLARRLPQQVDVIAALTACGHRIRAQLPQLGVDRADTAASVAMPTGLSHGAAGIAAALLQIATLTGDASWHDAALLALAAEDEAFDAPTGNWRRVPATRQHGPGCTWCHGAPGIALMRFGAMMQESHLTARLREHAEAALQTTWGHPIPDVDDLCCGEAGRLEILSLIAAWTHDADAAARVEAALQARLADWPSEGARFLAAKAPGAPEDPSLFRGLAGLGHLLVRQLAPQHAVPVLMPLGG